MRTRVKTIETPKPAGTVMLHAQLALLLYVLEPGFVEMFMPEVATICVPEHGVASPATVVVVVVVAVVEVDEEVVVEVVVLTAQVET